MVLTHNNEPWETSGAWWEENPPGSTVEGLERTDVPVPNGIVALMTMQYRYIRLTASEKKVIGFEFWSGVKFKNENMFLEKMTPWRRDKEGNCFPQLHDHAKQIWRNFAVFMQKDNDKNINPGVLKWISEVQTDGFTLPFIRMHIAGITYKSMMATIDNVFADDMGINASLLSDLNENWIIRINKLVAITENMASILGNLAADIAVAAGDSDGKNKRTAAKEEAYAQLDMPFRSWLASIDPNIDDIEESCREWVDIAKNIVTDIGEKLAAQAGPQAFIGRLVKVKNNFVSYTSPEAYGEFSRIINSIVKKEGYA